MFTSLKWDVKDEGSTIEFSPFNRTLKLNKYSETKMTGVHLAAYFGLGKTMSALLEKRQDVNQKDKDGRTPFTGFHLYYTSK
jgi:ankyrin repeat protein